MEQEVKDNSKIYIIIIAILLIIIFSGIAWNAGKNYANNEDKKVNTKIEENKCDGHWVQFDIHSDTDRDRILKAITIDPEIEKNNVKYTMITAKAGDVVKPFTGANMTLGDLFLRFDTREELDKAMSDPSQWLKIEYQD